MKKFLLAIILLLTACTPRALPLPVGEERLSLPIVRMSSEVLYGAEIDSSYGVMADEVRSLAEIRAEIVRTWILYDRVPKETTSNLYYLGDSGLTIITEVKASDKCWIDEKDFEAFYAWLDGIVRENPAVEIWEIWNEPEIGGCIPPYFGGWAPVGAESFTRFVNGAYDTVKAANPDALVMIGSFCLCYGDDDPNWRFVEYVLTHGRYDAVGFHHYSRYPADLAGAIDQLDKNVMRLRSWTDAPMYLTETSTITLEGCTLEVERYQAEWLTRVTGFARESELAAIVWYGLVIDWECSAMIGADGPRQVYYDAKRIWR
jgi:hypothetical protein